MMKFSRYMKLVRAVELGSVRLVLTEVKGKFEYLRCLVIGKRRHNNNKMSNQKLDKRYEERSMSFDILEGRW